MNDPFEKKVRAAAIAGWWVILIGYALLTLTWAVCLALVSARPAWMLALWGQDVRWDFMQTVSLWFLGLFKLFLWFLILIVLWLTLWARQLRKLDRQGPDRCYLSGEADSSMTIPAEELLTQYLEATLAAHSFKRIETGGADESLSIVAAWKRKTLSMNRGVALVSFTAPSAHPGAFVKAIKKPIGKLIGYVPFLYEFGLQLVLIGRGILDQATGLDDFLDTVNTQTVVLQSIHLVDVAARECLKDFPTDADVESDVPLPGWARGIELIGKIKSPMSGGFQRGKARLRYSVETGMAVIFVRTWGQMKTGALIDAIEDGIDRFIHQEKLSS